MADCSGPKTRRSFLSLFFLFFLIWHCLEVSRSSTAADSEAFCLYVCAPRWGLSEIPPVFVHMIQWEPCVSVWGLFFSCLFMSYTGGKDPATLVAGGLLLLIRRDNKLCRIHLTHNDMAFNAEWCFSQARMFQTGNGHPLKTIEIPLHLLPYISIKSLLPDYFLYSIYRGSRKGDENNLLSLGPGWRLGGRHMVRFKVLSPAQMKDESQQRMSRRQRGFSKNPWLDLEHENRDCAPGAETDTWPPNDRK